MLSSYKFLFNVTDDTYNAVPDSCVRAVKRGQSLAKWTQDHMFETLWRDLARLFLPPIGKEIRTVFVEWTGAVRSEICVPSVSFVW